MMHKRQSKIIKKQVVLISCVSKKLPHRAKAGELYISPLFKLNLKYAYKIKPDKIYILSAKHGILTLNQKIEPYNQTLNKMRTSEVNLWAERVLRQLKDVYSIEHTEFIFLAGERYRKSLLPHLNNYKIPLKGLRIGKQLQKLKRLTS